MSFGKGCLLCATFAAISFGQECSNASLNGAYGYTMKGTVTSGGKTLTNSEVGRIAFDGKGGFTGVAAVTSGGSVAVGEVSGQIAIGTDCTATGKATYPSATLEFDLVVVNSGNDFALVVRSAEATLSGTGTKIEGQGTCNAGSLTGNFGYQGEGVVAVDGRATSTAEIGILSFDGKGGANGTYSVIGGGQTERRSFTGVYELTDVCFASLGYKIGDVAYQMNFMLTAGGNQILYSEASAGYVATGAGLRTVPR